MKEEKRNLIFPRVTSYLYTSNDSLTLAWAVLGSDEITILGPIAIKAIVVCTSDLYT